MALRRGRDAAVLLPAAAGSAGLGFLASEVPIAAGGAVGLGVLLVLPWAALYVVLNLLSMIQSGTYGPLAQIPVLGYDFSPAHVILVPFAIRAYLTTRQDLRLHWGKPEWLLVAFAFIQPFITYRHAPSFHQSLGALGLVALGVLAYVVVYAAVCSRRRLLVAAKVFLWLILLNAAYGILAMAAHLVLHTHIGISTRSTYGSGVFGLSAEHDIFASTCAVGAIAFYILWRERNPIVSARLSGAAVWICIAGALLGLARGAWLGLALLFLVVMVLPGSGARRIRGIERMGVMLILLAFVGLGASYVVGSSDTVGTAFQAVEEKATDLVDLTSGSGLARLGETANALQDWKTSKLFGLGTGTYNQRHPLKDQTNYIGNIYLRALYETGLIGFLLLAGFLALLFWPNRSLLFASGELAPVARALTLGGAVVIIAYAATDATLLVWPWILFALVRSSRVLADREYRAARSVPSTAGLAPPATPSPVEGNGHVGARQLVRPRG